MARPKRASDEVYNARRRLQRQAARMEREAAKLTNQRLKEASLSYAQSLRDVANSARGKMTAEQRTQALERLATVRERTREAAYNRDARVRSNLIFAQQINAAGTDEAKSTLNKNAAKAFWVANKGLWTDGQNIKRNERYGKILAHWYGNTADAKKLEEWLIARKEKELKRKRGADFEGLTDDEKEQLIAESQGNLQLVYEFIAEQLEANEAGLTDLPELDYERVKKAVYVAH